MRRLAAFLVALVPLVAGCGDSGDPVLPSDSVTGRWKLPSADAGTATLELQELGDGALGGRLIFAEGGVPIGEYSLRDGSASGGQLSFAIDPLDPPVFPFLEAIGSIGVLRYSGSLDTRETLVLSVAQECGTGECLGADLTVPLATPLYTQEAQLSRPLGRGGSFASLTMFQNGSEVTGSLAIVFGSVLGGMPTQPLQLREGSVDSSNVVQFYVDPLDDPLHVVADSVHCSGRIHYVGRLDQGSTIRFTIRQDTTETDSVCVLGSTTWTARSVFDNFRDTVSVDVRGTAFDLAIATTQQGSVVEGSLTFENDAVREGPFTIEGGRFTAGRAVISVRPTELESIDFVRTLGAALPIEAELTVVGGTEVRISVEQHCSCEEGQFTASRIRIGH